ncbi:MAG: hypothetical protein CBD97_02115 [Pelagibacteraceae bacterium TMED237]|nr:MAG: hypothetical protein CBD97_02115 [Pelagibacteraceae bacterium TMED237]|tara:strand:+ start:2353 stop:3039 length:687 start_codon:yes stop_codon:yes gene_type:complete
MNNIRTGEITRCEKEIKNIQYILHTELESLNRIKLQGETEFVKVQILKYNQKEKEKKNEILELEKKLEDLKIGKLDSSIRETMKNNKKEEKLKLGKKLEKKLEIEQQNKDRVKTSQNFYQINRKSDSEKRYNKMQILKHWAIYTKSLNNLPDYILNNLKEMPNNKGYIYRGIYCFGELERNPNENNILFDKKKGYMNIHEWNNKEYAIYQKVGRNRKELIERHVRKLI